MLRFTVISAQFVRFLNVCISQGSVATHLRCEGNFYTSFAANFILFLAVKRKFENRLTFGKVIVINNMSPFSRHSI